MDAEGNAILLKIDETTTKTGANVATMATAVGSIADVTQQISDEMDAFIEAGSGLTPEDKVKLQAIADKAQAASDAGDAVNKALVAQVDVLKAVAAKGAPTTPLPPPPPPPVELSFSKKG